MRKIIGAKKIRESVANMALFSFLKLSILWSLHAICGFFCSIKKVVVLLALFPLVPCLATSQWGLKKTPQLALSFKNWPKDAFESWGNQSSQKKLDQREVLVRVVKQESGEQNMLIMKGWGKVSAPVSFAFQVSKKVESLAKESSFVESVKKISADSYEIKSQAYGYVAHMWVQLQYDEKLRAMQFKIFKGSFRGLEGLVRFRKKKTLESEVLFYSKMQYKELPAPASFLSFALEIVLQKMSYVMREMIEKSFKSE